MVKKKLLSVALVAVTVCSMIFTGCGNSAENTGNDTGKTDSDAQAGNTAGDVADDVEKSGKDYDYGRRNFPGDIGRRSGRMGQ